tara:strand:+ start:123 stop:371 length:249 start_codon:yes stop_codon:yes gene_type:complete
MNSKYQLLLEAQDLFSNTSRSWLRNNLSGKPAAAISPRILKRTPQANHLQGLYPLLFANEEHKSPHGIPKTKVKKNSEPMDE